MTGACIALGPVAALAIVAVLAALAYRSAVATLRLKVDALTARNDRQAAFLREKLDENTRLQGRLDLAKKTTDDLLKKLTAVNLKNAMEKERA